MNNDNSNNPFVQFAQQLTQAPQQFAPQQFAPQQFASQLFTQAPQAPQQAPQVPQQFAPPQQVPQQFAPPQQAAPQQFAPPQQVPQQFASQLFAQAPQPQAQVSQQVPQPQAQVSQQVPQPQARRSYFTGIGGTAPAASKGHPEDLGPANVQRDLTKPADSNIVSWTEAHYVLALKDAKFFVTRRRREYLSLTFEVLAASPGAVNRVGSLASALLDPTGDYFTKEMAALVQALTRTHWTALKDADFERAVSGGYTDVRLIARVGSRKSTKTGKDFPTIRYAACTQDTCQELADEALAR